METPHVVISYGQYGSLAHAIEAARVIAPFDHIAIVTSPHSAAKARREAACFDGVRVIPQLREQGSPDLLLPLTHAFARHPLDTIVFLPEEFSIVEPYALEDALRPALATPDTISVISLPPFEWRSGTQWNPMLAVGRITWFWDLLRTHQPRHAALLEIYIEAMGTEDEGTALVKAYEHMRPLDFTGDVLVKGEELQLATVPVAGLRSNIVSVLARHHFSRARVLHSA